MSMEDKHIKNKITWIAGCILLAAGFMLLCVSRFFRGSAQWYSIHIYPLWVGSIGRVMGIFPFSVSEILLYVVIISVIFGFLRLLVRAFRRQKVGSELFKWGGRICLLAGILFFLYAANCGVNYHRESFSESTGLEVKRDADGQSTAGYTAEELGEVCSWLTEEVNKRSGMVSRDEDGVMRLQAEEGEERGKALKETNKKAVAAMRHISREYPQLAGYYPSPKGLIFPWILSIQQLTGIYSPFTVEANYNSAVIDYNIPFTACHELSHLRGFMQEEEANFIAFLASSSSGDRDFQYSGYLMGWKYCMNALYKADYESWEQLRGRLSETVEPDLSANREFWDRYDTRIAEAANKINDTYLKANNQSEGVESYGMMVDLIVAYYSRANPV